MSLSFNVSGFSFYIQMNNMLFGNRKKILWRMQRSFWRQHFIEMASGTFLFPQSNSCRSIISICFSVLKQDPVTVITVQGWNGPRFYFIFFFFNFCWGDLPIIFIPKLSHFGLIQHLGSAMSPFCLLFHLFCISFPNHKYNLGNKQIKY